MVLGLGDFVSTATTIVGSQGGTRTAYTGDAADEIAGAFGKLANELEQLLNILIGKAGFLTQIPFVGPPVSAVLRLVESAVDVRNAMSPCRTMRIYCRAVYWRV